MPNADFSLTRSAFRIPKSEFLEATSPRRFRYGSACPSGSPWRPWKKVFGAYAK